MIRRRKPLRRTKPIRRRRPGRGYLIAHADAAFSSYVRGRDKECRAEGRNHSGPLQCAHVISRRYLATRWDRHNAVALCAGCHFYYGKRPLEWDIFVVHRLGLPLDAMKMQALAIYKPSDEELRVIAKVGYRLVP